ncbi:MAG TPA: ABC transporter ATP-binding protein [Woeseiaceae bacterium]|jgi:iron complex transport system ATP-binding protein
MKASSRHALGCEHLDIAVPGRSLVSNLQFSIAQGEFLAVLGQNGSGKSLTLHTLAGLRAVAAGKVFLQGALLKAASRRSMSTRLALLPQHTEDIFPSTVIDTVLIGRHPHISRFRWESDADRRIAHDALRAVDLEALAGRDLATLSGGERQRVAVAQVLAQCPDVYLLDEPSNQLDPQHQLSVLRLFRERSRFGHAVIASLHDVNLAARFADHCLLLFGDGRWLLGETRSVLTTASLSELYATPIESVPWHDRELFVTSGDPCLPGSIN